MADLKKDSNYYYLDGIDKKGPYNSDEIKARKLSSETLIYKDGNTNWLPLSNFPELNKDLIVEQNELTNHNESNLDAEKKEKEIAESIRIKVPSFVIILLGLIVCTGISYVVVYLEKSNDSNRFKNEVDNLLNGKAAISDYSYSGTTGQLYKVFLSSPLGDGYEKTTVQTKKHFLISKPFLKEDAKDYEVQEYNRLLQQWNDFKEFVEYYESDKYTGFTVLRLEKNFDRYIIETTWSGDMAYKIGEYKHIEGYSSNYYSSPGYDIPTNRPSISEAYKEAAKYLTVENEDNSYEAGSYAKISSLPYMESDFFEIEQDYPRYSYYSDTIFVEHRPNERRGWVIDYYRISSNTSRTDGSVFSGYWKVWYKNYQNKYSIKEKPKVLIKKVSIYSLGLFLVFIVSFYIFRFRKRIQIQ